MKDNTMPPCFTPEQWQEWQEASDYQARTGNCHPVKNYCIDCTRDYKIKMMEQARCIYPDTVFIPRRTQSGVETIGIRHPSPSQRKKSCTQHSIKISSFAAKASAPALTG